MYSMINPSVDSLLKKVDNKYVLATLVAKRSRQLFEGDDILIDDYFVNLVTTAVNEIAQDKIEYVANELEKADDEEMVNE